ncbi:hypothetical protein GGR52DRAFT_443656 [Hypoxylon sp. FL1284]|nr:hypothetical protein GGR52DRAFT_443656 [Hypoxylon sp. FL1284]
MFSPRVLLAGLLAANIAVASPQGGPIISTTLHQSSPTIISSTLHQSTPTALPGHCSTTIDDFEHTFATVKTHECFTHTRPAPSPTCPLLSCRPPPTDAICPEIIRVSSVTVPCATDCCPTTSTKYVSTAACPTCADCPIPTQWITYTTGCPNTPTITASTIITPAWNTPSAN